MQTQHSGSQGALSASIPGVVIDHSPARTMQYIGSPSLAVLPGGEYIASRDVFGPGSTWDTTLVYASDDRGLTWWKQSELRGQWWSTIFVHRGELYLIGTTREYGLCVIRKSVDGGRTWSQPLHRENGLLCDGGMFHCAPVPLVRHNGRLWRGMEEYVGPKWGAFRAFILSVDEDADLLKASSWMRTNAIGISEGWLDGQVGGILEGNAVVTPQGEVADVLRVHHPGYDERAAVMQVSDQGNRLEFNPESGFIHMPGGSKKFTIRYHEPTQKYWSLVNPAPENPPLPGFRPDQVRNQLALSCSADLVHWVVRRVILSHPDVKYTGFQYADWQFDGADLIAVVRTAFKEVNGENAHSAHDANWLTFHRIDNFIE